MYLSIYLLICKASYIYIYIYIYRATYNHHHHHIMLVARISLTLSRHSSLSFIALRRSSGQHPVSSHSCWMYVRAGRPAFARPCVGVHKSTSLMSSSLLLQQCPACTNTHTHTHTYIYIYIYINLYAKLLTHMHSHIHALTYTLTYTHTHIYIYIYIYICSKSHFSLATTP